jgi:cell division protein FtsI/penicillin-binding protein 2
MQERAGRQLARRARGWCVVALILFLALGARLWVIQVAEHERHQQQADETRGRSWPIRAPRGNIYDRNGNPLALNVKLFSVAADPKLIGNPAETAARLAEPLRMSAEELARRLGRRDTRWVALRESVDERVAAAVRRVECAGLIIDTEWKRVYPHEMVAAALLGFLGKDRRGLSGVEAALDEQLTGSDGEMVVVLDGRLPRSRSQIPGLTVVRRHMRPGSSVVLTTDLEIQAIAEEELAKAVREAEAGGGTAIVMDPETGEVLAVATQPGFDANDFRQYDAASWVSQAVVSPYEPGSTFKVITACAAIEEGVMSHGEIYECTGTRSVGNRTISCALHGGRRDHGAVSLDDIVVKSCNVGMATVALALGAERLHRWARRFGFGERTGIELSGESAGMLPPPGSWSRVQLANVGFGQGVSVTWLQLLSAYCAVGNGGRQVHPHVVKLVRDADGQMRNVEPGPGERILSERTAERMRAALERAVTEGTGQRAQIAGRRVAGKTGTAQKPSPEAGYRSGKYIGSFVGFAPAEDPRLAILVAIDEPKTAHYGGVVAAPAFRAICGRALAYLRVPPDAPTPMLHVARAGGRG